MAACIRKVRFTLPRAHMNGFCHGIDVCLSIACMTTDMRMYVQIALE